MPGIRLNGLSESLAGNLGRFGLGLSLFPFAFCLGTPDRFPFGKVLISAEI